jgi:opacity protein-like surface antigen
VKENGHHPHSSLCDRHSKHDGARLMRWLLCVAALVFAQNAFAADYTPPPPVTIGPATFTRWAGFYFGGQIGYSDAQADSNYTHSPFTIVANSTPISLVVPACTNTDSVNISATGSLSMTDYGSLRARAGWILGDFLPYAFGGFALGHGSYTVGTLVSGQQATPPTTLPCVASPTCVNFSFPNSTGGSGVFLYGFSVGGGLDVALTPFLSARRI